MTSKRVLQEGDEYFYSVRLYVREPLTTSDFPVAHSARRADDSLTGLFDADLGHFGPIAPPTLRPSPFADAPVSLSVLI